MARYEEIRIEWFSALFLAALLIALLTGKASPVSHSTATTIPPIRVVCRYDRVLTLLMRVLRLTQGR